MKYPAPKGPIIEPKPDEKVTGVTHPEAETAPAGEEQAKKSPVRYGDWEINGRCIDF
jgi:hypothetical protein